MVDRLPFSQTWVIVLLILGEPEDQVSNGRHQFTTASPRLSSYRLLTWTLLHTEPAIWNSFDPFHQQQQSHTQHSEHNVAGLAVVVYVHKHADKQGRVLWSDSRVPVPALSSGTGVERSVHGTGYQVCT